MNFQPPVDPSNAPAAPNPGAGPVDQYAGIGDEAQYRDQVEICVLTSLETLAKATAMQEPATVKEYAQACLFLAQAYSFLNQQEQGGGKPSTGMTGAKPPAPASNAGPVS